MNETPFQKIVKNRRSIRRFSSQSVAREKILACLEAARLAPSAHNVQPWRFLVVDDPAIKERLCQAAFSGIFSPSKFSAQAPVIIVMMARKDLLAGILGTRIRKVPFYILDTGIAGEHIVLQAEELGLSTCWVGWFNERKLRKELNIPRRLKIIALLPLGYAEKRPTRCPKKKELNEIVWFNTINNEIEKNENQDKTTDLPAASENEGE